MKVRERTDAAPRTGAISFVSHRNPEQAMTEDQLIDPKVPGLRINRMSLYAASADYERRLSEDVPRAPEPDIDDACGEASPEMR